MSDIFVAYPPATQDGYIIFGKNSDRPPSEVQEVVYYPAADHSLGSKVHCSFIEVNQVEHTHAVILSKPAWTWGAEMGANEHGVCVGCTSVWTKLSHPGDHQEKLLGVDFVRLALERGSTSKGALDVVTQLLEKHGQGGPNSEDRNFGQWSYHNSFLIADSKEAWILETAGQFWAANNITEGTRNLSSELTITTEFVLSSEGLKEKAQSGGYWKPDDGDFNFAAAFAAEFFGLSLSESQQPSNRLKRGKELMENNGANGSFNEKNMFEILRAESSSINFSGELLTVASQVSVLCSNPNIPNCHWFTATPNPAVSVFKPFIFCANNDIGDYTVSPSYGDKARTSFQTAVNRRHLLYDHHDKVRELMASESQDGKKLKATLRDMETQCVNDVHEFLQSFTEEGEADIFDLFKDVTSSEVKFYM